MTDPVLIRDNKPDRGNIIVAGLVFLISFIVYAMTVQQSLSFWDCGEFIACANILGIPHPPGTPLFVIIGRIFAIIPFVEDIAHRINYISVISSAFTAMFSYLLAVRLIRYFFAKDDHSPLCKLICYVGGFVAGLTVAFGRTNWGNSVEAEVYGLAMALSVMIIWLTVRFWEERGSSKALRYMILAMFLATLGIGIHMTVFLVVPVCAIFWILKKDATKRDFILICAFALIEFLLVMLFADNRGGPRAYYIASGLLAIGLLVLLYKRINWAIVVAVGSVSSVMMSFSAYQKATPVALLVLLGMALFSKRTGVDLKWKTGLTLLVIGFMGISVHAFIPIRSSINPRIDENNPSRDWRTFTNFLDRRQYGQESMVERMFHRRGEWSNQFGRHAHMGFWSYFEEQWSQGGAQFVFVFFLLGMIGMIVAILKRAEIGMPFFTLFIVCSVGLILYMNFADGTQYNEMSGDAYMEVRDRDYFFTPAFVFFGIAIGMGVAAILTFLKDSLAGNEGTQKMLVRAGVVLALLPGISLAHSYHTNDRSNNFIPYNYAANLLDTCEPNAILFTSGDNDTFPVWCLQEVYNYRRDVRVVNLSLLNTDWYVEQMKNRYDVPISLSEEEILWYPYEVAPGVETQRPKKQFYDRARRRHTFLQALPYGGRLLRVQDMMVDDIVWESTIKDGDSLELKNPIYFSSQPYAESPLGLRQYTYSIGLLYKLDWTPPPRLIDADAGYDLFMNDYRYDGYQDSKVYRDENATGVFVTIGVNSGKIFDDLMFSGDTSRAMALGEKMLEVYPEYWQNTQMMAYQYELAGDTVKANELWYRLRDTLTAFCESNPENLFYLQDLGLTDMEMGLRFGDSQMVDEGLDLSWQAFIANPNSNFAFRKLVTVMARSGRDIRPQLRDAIELQWKYKVNQADPFLQQIRREMFMPSTEAPVGG
ncbi:MAG TPA: DUF2723 domain-containing protein [candidate division Zixibacteria bacterium]|nr:DUF2723 domain-containing protein [candidate division Zixibacteria bacterium]